MTYHANHNTCHNSNWNSKPFHGEVMVHFGNNLTKTDILNNNKSELVSEILNKKNPDFINLVDKKDIINKNKYEDFLEVKLRVLSKKLNRELTKEEKKEIENKIDKDNFFDLSYSLKPNVAKWLEENIKNVKNIDGTEIKDINERKGWCIGDNEYIAKDGEMNIFFKRELDALKFIREFSVFKEPVFYFDYFSDDRRCMDLNKYIHLYNEYAKNNNLDLIDISKVNLDNHYQGNINLDPLTFRLLDWEKMETDPETREVYQSDDIELNKSEMFNYVKSLYKINNNDISYNNLKEVINIVDYPIYFNLKDTNKISLGYEIPKKIESEMMLNDLIHIEKKALA